MIFQTDDASSWSLVAEAFPAAQGALPSQGHSHPHTDWGSVDTPIDPTCPPLGCGRKPNAQRKPTCKLQTVALAHNWFPRVNVRMKRQWTKPRLSRNCCRSHRFFGRHQKYTELAISQPWGTGSQKPAGERVAKYLFWTQASCTHHGHASIAWPAGWVRRFSAGLGLSCLPPHTCLPPGCSGNGPRSTPCPLSTEAFSRSCILVFSVLELLSLSMLCLKLGLA